MPRSSTGATKTKSIVQTCEVTWSVPRAWELCSVYACDERGGFVLSVGGGDSKTTSRTTTRLCKEHAAQMRDSLTEVIRGA